MDVTGPTDVSSVAVDDQDANAPHVFFYPTDWSLSLGNRMGLYYSEAAGGSVSKVYYTINDSTGWPTGALNDPASWATAEWYVIYWDGATWGDQVPIDFFWDGSISGPSHDCIENVSAVVHVTGGTARSMAFKILDGDDCGTGLDDETYPLSDDHADAAIVFAELAN